jgi:hypothetical protein
MKRLLAWSTRFAGGVLAADVLAALLVAVLCLLLDWTTTRQYGVALMWAGWLMIGLAGAAFSGGRQILGNPSFWYAQSVMPKSLHERWRLNMQDPHDDVSVTGLLAVSGLVDAALGLWLQTL